MSVQHEPSLKRACLHRYKENLCRFESRFKDIKRQTEKGHLAMSLYLELYLIYTSNVKVKCLASRYYHNEVCFYIKIVL